MQACPLEGRTPGPSQSTLGSRERLRHKLPAPCTISTATAPALMVVLFLHAPLPGCPHPGVCRVTLPETYTTHKWTNAAPGPVHTRRVSAMTLRDSAGERAHQIRGAFLLLVIQRPEARSCSKGLLQCATREVEAAAATAPRHFSRAILLSSRSAPGWGPACLRESSVVQLSGQARTERGRPVRWQSWVPSA